MNGFRQEGFGPFDSQVHRGRRMSASRAYLHPAMKRKNLTVETRAFVTEIHYEGRRATGVTYKKNGNYIPSMLIRKSFCLVGIQYATITTIIWYR